MKDKIEIKLDIKQLVLVASILEDYLGYQESQTTDRSKLRAEQVRLLLVQIYNSLK